MRVRQSGERGAIAVVATVVLLTVGAFMALALNVGLIMNTKGQLQNASDSAALAAAGSLEGTSSGLTAARQMALDYSNAHKVTEQTVTIDSDSDVIFGRWHFVAEDGWSARTFEPIEPNAYDPALGGPNFLRITAVKVTNGRDGGDHNTPLDTFFGAFLMTDRKTEVPSAAIAVGNAARSDCPLPFGVASCKVLDNQGELSCDGTGVTRTLSFANANIDGVGFINVVNDEPINGNKAADLIRDRSCGDTQDFHTGPAKMQDGTDMNDQVTDALMGLTKSGNSYTRTGPCLLYTSDPNQQPEVSVAVTDNEGCDTNNPIFNGDQPVIAFAQARLIEVCDNLGNSVQCDGTATTACTYPAPSGTGGDNGGAGGGKRNITIQLLCAGAAGSGGAGKVLRLVK
jgi:Flp pilus assembly protein TadG